MSENNRKEIVTQVVSWVGVVEVGHKVKYDVDNVNEKNAWISNGGYDYCNGFMCIRNLLDKATNKTYRVTCSISSSLLNKPLFNCLVETGTTQQKFIAMNPTTVMRKGFNFTAVNPNGWNGNLFFGLHRKDVQLMLKNAVWKTLTTDNSSNQEELLIRSSSNTRWVGVISLGNVSDKKFQIEVGTRNRIWTPAGYEAVRKVKYDCRHIALHCKIENKDDKPFYTCYTKEDPLITLSSFKISEVVRTALKQLNITSTRRWSGVDFFGLTRSDVISHMKAKENSLTCGKEKTEAEITSKKSYPNVLIDVLNTKHRNAGPTGNLCAKAKKQRNELIHQLVLFASSGDVKGM